MHGMAGAAFGGPAPGAVGFQGMGGQRIGQAMGVGGPAMMGGPVMGLAGHMGGHMMGGPGTGMAANMAHVGGGEQQMWSTSWPQLQYGNYQ